MKNLQLWWRKIILKKTFGKVSSLNFIDGLKKIALAGRISHRFMPLISSRYFSKRSVRSKKLKSFKLFFIFVPISKKYISSGILFVFILALVLELWRCCIKSQMITLQNGSKIWWTYKICVISLVMLKRKSRITVLWSKSANFRWV